MIGLVESIALIGYQFIPEKARGYVRQIRRNRMKARMKSLPPLTEEMFKSILTQDFQLKTGSVVFIHSSINGLSPAFEPSRILSIIRETIGDEGTILTPTYPRLPSYRFLLSGEVFDVRNSPSYSGAVSEELRTQEGALRSLHPVKSVCAVGPLAMVLTESHQNSPYPYDYCSPYYKIIPYQGIIIGLGVVPHYLSFVHVIEDAMKEEFPVAPYHKKCFEAKCINYAGEMEIVKTYGHNMHKMCHNIPKLISTRVSDKAGQCLKIYGRDFFRIDTQTLFNEMIDLAKRNITIYPRVCYKWKNLMRS